MSDFQSRLETSLFDELSNLHLPTLSASQMSRIIMFHAINASAEYDQTVHTLSIREHDPRSFTVSINQDITINLNLKQTQS